MKIREFFSWVGARMREKPHPYYVPAVGELSEAITEWVQDTGLSPCHGANLVAGPAGGIMRNCWCEECHARYNISVDSRAPFAECTMEKDDVGFRLLASKSDTELDPV